MHGFITLSRTSLEAIVADDTQPYGARCVAARHLGSARPTRPAAASALPRDKQARAAELARRERDRA